MVEDDVTRWIRQLAEGDQAAAQNIWSRYYAQLVRLARRKLRADQRRMADEEDVALSAFNSFYQGVVAGRFPKLDDRQDLWKLLVTITARKAASYARREHRQKRGGGQVRGESVFVGAASSRRVGDINAVAGAEPTPEFAALVAEECRRLLDCLDSESLRQIALMKLEGHNTLEIAQKLDCARETVQRKLRRIRRVWTREIEP
jgi:DNA-directed RNA polymerase specialized sigma24 family protein